MAFKREVPDRPDNSQWSIEAWPEHFWTKRTPQVRLVDGLVASVFDPKLYSPGFIARLLAETRWVPNSELPKIAPGQSRVIGLDRQPCPLCRGIERTSVRYTGGDTGIVVTASSQCECRRWRLFYPAWAKVPARYQSVSWAGLAPVERPEMPLSLARQQTIIDGVKAHANDSFLFWGAAGSGKTHISYALHRQALESWSKQATEDERPKFNPCPVLRAQVTILLDQLHALKTFNRKRDDEARPDPPITDAKIKQIAEAKGRPILILDEIDKLGNVTEFKTTTILALLERVYESNGRLICTSNRSPEWMEKAWGKELAEPILRRCGNAEDAHTVEFNENV